MLRPLMALAGLLIVTAATVSAYAHESRSPYELSSATPRQAVCGKTFQEADINKDGVLTRIDLVKMDQHQDFIDRVDSNHDGIVTVAEFNAGCAKNLLHKA